MCFPYTSHTPYTPHTSHTSHSSLPAGKSSPWLRWPLHLCQDWKEQCCPWEWTGVDRQCHLHPTGLWTHCGMNSSPPCGAGGTGPARGGPCWFGFRAAEHRLFLSVFHKHQNTSCSINSPFLVSKAAALASSCSELDLREVFC